PKGNHASVIVPVEALVDCPVQVGPLAPHPSGAGKSSLIQALLKTQPRWLQPAAPQPPGGSASGRRLFHAGIYLSVFR
ncbi:hypothetical protein NL292_26155, partial [Klebsiella pneumoniae]|nr:hypothetical protein [Klebsiella pneumoniae]